MIELLSFGKNPPQQLDSIVDGASDEEQLVRLIYRFANKKDEWFNLLLSLSNCISVSDSLPADHPYQEISGRLLAHLKNAIKISTQLNVTSKFVDADSVLNHIPMGVGIIDHSGRIIEINQQAQTLLSQSADWNINQNYLYAQHISLTHELNTLNATEKGFVVLPFIQNSADKKSVTNTPSFHITQIPNQHATTQYYFCIHTQQTEFVDIELLKQHYQLTETEALVVSTLVQEISSQKTAKRLKLKETTIRGHLSSIYLKLDVKRKPELIRKVLLHSLLSLPKLTTPDTNQLKLVTPNSTENDFIYLPDGRKLSYLDYQSTAKDIQASEHQEVILLLHNVMGSACEIPPDSDATIRAHGLRIIIPERPSYGDSSPHKNRTHQDFCKDIEVLLNHLKIKKVKVIAHSIGGAYALALAEFLPQRISRIAMVNAFTRLEDFRQAKPIPILITAVLQGVRFAPFLIELILKMAIGKDIEHFYEQQLTYIRPTAEGLAADINLLSRRNYRDYSILNLRQSVKQGVATWANEIKLSFSEWDFNVTNKTMEYQFWHGDQDDVISFRAAESLASDLNTINFNLIKNETHFLFSRHFNQVVEQLIGVNQNTKQKYKQLDIS